MMSEGEVHDLVCAMFCFGMAAGVAAMLFMQAVALVCMRLTEERR